MCYHQIEDWSSRHILVGVSTNRNRLVISPLNDRTTCEAIWEPRQSSSLHNRDERAITAEVAHLEGENLQTISPLEMCALV